MATTPALPQLLTIDDLAEQLATSERHIRRLIDERRIPYLKVGKFVRFDVAEIAEWLESARCQGPEAKGAGRDMRARHEAGGVRRPE